MRDLSDEFKLSVRSIPEVYRALGEIVSQLAVGRRVRFRGKKPTRAAVVNASLLYLDSLPAEEWERVLVIGLQRLEEILASNESPGPSQPVGPEPPPTPSPPKRVARPKRVQLDVSDVSPPPSDKPVGRKKRR